jgi:hypothetical protein
MSVFPAEHPRPRRRFRRRLTALVLGVLWLGAWAAPAGAQTQDNPQQPLSLVPPAGLGTANILAPGGGVVPTVIEAPAAATAAGSSAIEVNPLEEIAPDSIGTLDPRTGGFGADMWQGSDRQIVTRLLGMLPGAMSSRGMRSLARRLLTSIASPPISQFDFSDETERSLLALRIDRLMALGEVAELNDLLALVPGHRDDEQRARTRVDGMLLTHDTAEACRLVRHGIASYHQVPYWRKAMVLCQMIGGEVDQMTLGLDLLRETGADDPVFFALAGAVFGAEPKIPGDATLTPLHLAMIQTIGIALPPDYVAGASPALLSAIAQAPNLDSEQRAAAAERACAMGLLDGAELARVYDGFSFTAQDLAGAIGATGTMTGPRLNALLYRAARDQNLPSSRAEILRVALELGETEGLYQALVPVYLPLLLEIPVTPELTWFAADAGRALYAAGRYEQASAWLRLGRQEALINPQASTAAASLWPYSRLAGGAALTTDGTLAAWRDLRAGMSAGGEGDAEGGSAALHRSQTLLRAVFQALGERDPLSWGQIAAEGDAANRIAPNAALLYALNEASESRRIGETVLLSLIVLGAEGPGGSHAFALSAALTALGRVGLETEARSLAIEAALANGI